MKFRSLFLTVLTTMILASCNDDSEMANDSHPNDDSNAQAYMALTIDMLRSMRGIRNTNSGNNDAGTKEESEITSALVIFLENDILFYSHSLETATAGVASDAFEVKGRIPNALIVIANPTDKIKKACEEACKATIEFSKWDQTFENSAIADITSGNKFLMTTLTKFDCTQNVMTVSPQGPYHSIAAAKSAAIKNPATVSVDRVVSKITLVSDKVKAPEGVTVAIERWGLNVTNTKFFLMPKKEERVNSSDYYEDPNYGPDTKITDFAHISVGGLKTVKEKNLYCLENTMDAAQQVNAYTTQAVIEVQYTPNGYSKGDSWFRFHGHSYKSLSELQTKYADTANPDPLLVKACDEFLIKMRGKGLITATNFLDLNITELDEIGNGGGGIVSKEIEYYQHGFCYYPILIRHDSSIETPMALGRWGVVRNNWYTLTINSISGPGTPEIEVPEVEVPDDLTTAFISVTITVNPWRKWEQNVDL